MKFDWILQESGTIAGLFWSHLVLSVVPVLIGLALALPLGWAAQRSGIFKSALLGAAGLLYTIPALALFVLLPGIIGTRILDPLNVVIALTLYSLALLVRTVSDGLDSVPEETQQAADAMGYRALHRLVAVELPIAIPVIAANLRVAVVSNVSVVSVAALIGTPQLGLLFSQGMQQRFLTPIIVGIVLCLLLAVLLDGLVILLAARLTSWQPRKVQS
ncbi:ABC transporter permease [Pseudomonas gingeri NCPPB 3146 = LMG 5327]|uniref:ABC transporter permease subunit n=2 Tax=Pseudomonas gingeri TaxID=117681 RepID=A0A7Y8CBG8_9PSED|nr:MULTISPECIES: ABC transporter permease subunit [Pseudomonas]NVZ60506.1 ABC transporter permease subunit [Pseudomonas gingeri]NVZ78349.1 ABC transporter permease subunit [Pseudomonas gingeri]NWA08773.1 ABC transporter permease subunit [Pseudomonas gingeri]NWC12719.1 ABC transporter permease subunit [Pseudomonas gingeri]NWE49482.1 ABC transporter permease subunit [Pseudomonas gingeri]